MDPYADRKPANGKKSSRVFLYDDLGNTLFKTCMKCKELKHILEFYKTCDKQRPDWWQQREGRRYILCKKCFWELPYKAKVRNKSWVSKPRPINKQMIDDIIQIVKLLQF